MLVTALLARLPWEQKNGFEIKSYFLQCGFIFYFFGMHTRSYRCAVGVELTPEMHICLEPLSNGVGSCTSAAAFLAYSRSVNEAVL